MYGSPYGLNWDLIEITKMFEKNVKYGKVPNEWRKSTGTSTDVRTSAKIIVQRCFLATTELPFYENKGRY